MARDVFAYIGEPDQLMSVREARLLGGRQDGVRWDLTAARASFVGQNHSFVLNQHRDAAKGFKKVTLFTFILA